MEEALIRLLEKATDEQVSDLYTVIRALDVRNPQWQEELFHRVEQNLLARLNRAVPPR
jgi:hypothetical protein